MALELSEKTWKLGFTTGLGQEPRQRDIPGRAVQAMEAEIRAAEHFGLSPETPVVSCYEAGRDGFWLHRCLRSFGSGRRSGRFLQRRGGPAAAAGQDRPFGREEAFEDVGALTMPHGAVMNLRAIKLAKAGR